MEDRSNVSLRSAFDRHDFDFDAIHGAENLRRDDFFGRAGMGESAPVQDRHALGADKGLVGIVRRQDDRDAAAGEGLDLRQHAHLVTEVEAGGRLIHHQHLRFLRQRAGDQRKLALAAAHVRVRTVGKIVDARSSKQFVGDFPVSR